jgi:hypothetical protein
LRDGAVQEAVFGYPGFGEAELFSFLRVTS